jgi:hypothetical protein
MPSIWDEEGPPGYCAIGRWVLLPSPLEDALAVVTSAATRFTRRIMRNAAIKTPRRIATAATIIPASAPLDRPPLPLSVLGADVAGDFSNMVGLNLATASFVAVPVGADGTMTVVAVVVEVTVWPPSIVVVTTFVYVVVVGVVV